MKVQGIIYFPLFPDAPPRLRIYAPIDHTTAMRETPILLLHLLSALPGSTLYEGSAWSAAKPIQGELFWAFEDRGDFLQSSEQGPILAKPLPPPRLLAELSEGDYFFLQWRQKDYDSVEEGLENFARQLWWEGAGGQGPWILRVLDEGDSLTYQALKACKKT